MPHVFKKNRFAIRMNRKREGFGINSFIDPSFDLIEEFLEDSRSRPNLMTVSDELWPIRYRDVVLTFAR